MKKTTLIALFVLLQLWTSAQNFSMIEDIYSGSQGSNPGIVKSVLQDKWLFVATDSVYGREPWITDGTIAGTYMLGDLASGAASSTLYSVYEINNLLVFALDDGVLGAELWVSDGTPSGTYMLRDIFPGQSSSFSTFAFGFKKIWQKQDRLYFIADDGVHGNEIWYTDGTSSGTAILKDILPGPSSSLDPSAFWMTNIDVYDCDSVLYFTANDGVSGMELWFTDGTNSGTQLFFDGNPGPLGSFDAASWASFKPIPYVGGLWFFTVTISGLVNRELVITDGTIANTRSIGSFVSADELVNKQSCWIINNTLVFIAGQRYNNWELWKSDGSSSGTTLLMDINQDTINGSLSDYAFRDAFEINGNLYFIANDGIHGDEIWKTDATYLGTELLKDINPGTVGSDPNSFYFIQDQGFYLFAATDSIHGFELWKTDGSFGGTEMVYDVFPGPISGLTSLDLNMISDSLFSFAGTDAISGREIWVTNGESFGTKLLLDFTAGPLGSVWQSLQSSIVDKWYFTSSTTALGNEMYVTDGTTTGTSLVLDIYPGPSSSNPYFWEYYQQDFSHAPFVFDGKYWLIASRLGVSDREFWALDPVTLQCTQIVDLNPGPNQGVHSPIYQCGNGFLFIGNDGVHGIELWFLDTSIVSGNVNADVVDSAFEVYPNPFSLSYSKSINIYPKKEWKSITLFSIEGRVINCDVSLNKVKLDADVVKPGFYIVSAIDDDDVVYNSRIAIIN